MGKEARMKEIRKQLRNVVKENLPEVLTQEFAKNTFDRLSKENSQAMKAIADGARNTLETIDKRNKDFQSYMIRQVAGNVPVLGTTPEELAKQAPIAENTEVSLTPESSKS